MRLAVYLSDLLYRYECVIVPEFGGFIANVTSAKMNTFTHTFSPPSKQITFNSHLKNNDGLLANYISSVEKITFTEAVSLIKQEVDVWNQMLKSEVVEIAKVGSLSLNKEGKLLFDPSISENYLTSSFGLTTFSSPAIKREEYLEKANKLKPVIHLPVQKRRTPVFLKYAASAAILFVAGSFIWNTYNENQYQEQLLVEQQQQEAAQEAVDQKIQQATFIIENPLPTITLNVIKEVRNYHIIAGAFRESINADKKVQQLIKKGFEAQILGVNKWGLTQVAYASFKTRSEALQNLATIKSSDSSEAWLLIQKY